ncbi:MAG: 3-isopropylmalate dehydratase small subunit [Acidobacteria bacterium]|nr:MAG: 3-isopropylmalate dehydratase small subunit [Acidobacteriota bacterium]
MPVREIRGRAIPLPGNDIDTDRIIPGRFLRCVTFEGLEKHVFEDDRQQYEDHPFNQERYRGASILVVERNFGCGSSREHAPQALFRWGIRAIVGISFGEIFFSNCTAIGIPCLTLDESDAYWLLETVSHHPDEELSIDLETVTIRMGERTLRATMPEGARQQFLQGTWDSTQTLLEAGEAIDRLARRLPYIAGF